MDTPQGTDNLPSVVLRGQKDSVAGRARTASILAELPKPPKELPALTDEETELWNRYVKYRTKWREHDYHRIYELVKLDMKIASLWARLSKEDDVLESDKGNLSMNPLYNVLSNLRTGRKDLWKFLKLDIQREDIIHLRPIEEPKEPPLSHRERIERGLIINDLSNDPDVIAFRKGDLLV